MKIDTIINTFILVIVSFLLTTCADVPGTSKGSTAIDFKLKDIYAQTHQLSEYKGKVVMIHFWTDWCNACRAEFPRIQDFYADLKSDDFELLAINVGQPMTVSLDFKESFSVTFPMLVDDKKAIGDLYKVEGFPTNYFISPDGKIIKKEIGWVDRKQVEVIINQHKNTQNKTVLNSK